MSILDHIKSYWNLHPAGEAEVKSYMSDREAFFSERDRQTELLYPTLDSDYRFDRSRGKSTLELGCGMGYNAQRLAQNGARLVVIDLASRAVDITKERFLLRGLDADFVIASCENLPFSSESFQMVFSSGVIHHTPDTEQAAREIVRVMMPNSIATIMVYNRNSRWFWWNIVIVLGSLMFVINWLPEIVRTRLFVFWPNWRDLVLAPGKRMSFADILRAGTDFGGLRNPLSKVYDRQSVKNLFSGLVDFQYVTQFNQYKAMVDNPSWTTKVVRSILSWMDRIWGWFLIVHGKKP